MELPHLTLYLRRLKADPATLHWREALGLPPVRLALAAAFSTWAAAFTMLLVYADLVVFPSSGSILNMTLQYLRPMAWIDGLCWTGVAIALFLAADCCSQLGIEKGGTEPQWYWTTLESKTATLGVLGASLLSALPALIGVLASMVLIKLGLGFADHPSEWNIDLVEVLLKVARLPAFALAAGAFAILLRRHRWRNFAPAVLSAVAVVLMYRSVTAFGYADPQLSVVNGLWSLLGGCILLITIQMFMVFGAGRQEQPLLSNVIAIALLVLPMLPAVLRLGAVFSYAITPGQKSVDDVLNGWYTQSLFAENLGIEARQAAAMIYPSLDYELFFSFRWMLSEEWMTGELIHLAYVSVTLAMTALSTFIWWQVTLACLDAARGRLQSSHRLRRLKGE